MNKALFSNFTYVCMYKVNDGIGTILSGGVEYVKRKKDPSKLV